MWARVWQTLAAAEEPLETEVFSLGEPAVDVEPRVGAPQFLEETVEALRLFPRERVQQRTAGQIVDVPQFLEETVEVVRVVSRE